MFAKNKYSYWQWLRSKQSEHGRRKFHEEKIFDKWLEQRYGIVPVYDHQGYITSSYTIVDEKKYMWLTLAEWKN
jgi:hypothetical protein